MRNGNARETALRIAQIAPLQLPVPPLAYGGTERVISNLTEELVRLGHDVTLIASGDSHTSAHLVAPLRQALRFDPDVDAIAYHLAALDELYSRAEEFDVIHSHLDYLTLPFVTQTTTPTFITLHGRLDAPEFQYALRRAHEVRFVAISAAQQAYIPDLPWARCIHHGIDVEHYPFSPEPGRYLAFVGRISPEKGPERAIAIAHRTGIPLKIAAVVNPKDRPYFEEVIRPLLADPLVEYLGPLDEQRKRLLLRDALALLLPLTWPEPFGLVFIESLACGTPVLTCPRGAAPEIVSDGITGYLRDDDDALAEAALCAHTLSRQTCREDALRRFTVKRMALDYLQIYQDAITTRKTTAMLPHPMANMSLSNLNHEDAVCEQQ